VTERTGRIVIDTHDPLAVQRLAKLLAYLAGDADQPDLTDAEVRDLTGGTP
jgi:hypothetical protein